MYSYIVVGSGLSGISKCLAGVALSLSFECHFALSRGRGKGR